MAGMAHRATTRPEMTDATVVIVAIGETDGDPAPPDARIATAMSIHMRPAAAIGTVSARTVTEAGEEEEEALVLVAVGTATAETENGTATGAADATVATTAVAALRDAIETCSMTAEATDAIEAIEATGVTGVTVATGVTEATVAAATETKTFSRRIAVAAAPRRPRKESPLPISPMSSRFWSASAA